MSDFNLKKLIEELSTYAHHFYQRCRINVCIADENIKNEGMCPIPIEYADLEGENAQRQKGEGRNRFGIEPGQVVYFVSCHCTLDIALSCGLSHIIARGGTWKPGFTRHCCVLDRPRKNGTHNDTHQKIPKF